MSTPAKEIFPAEAFAKAQQGALFVDVREQRELDAEAYDVPDLLHIPMGELERRFTEIPRDRDVVIVCRGGGRSLHALHFLIAQGYANAANMKQGILGWMREGFPVFKNETLTHGMGFISINQL
jgi:rhodanese-related sulfurtransferase